MNMPKGTRCKRSIWGKRLIRKISSFFSSLKTVNWGIEVVNAILTSFIILLISTAVLGVISHFSPGEYSGELLKQYLLKTVCQEIGVEYSEDGIAISRILYGLQDGILANDIIVLCGEYATDPSFIDLYLDGHYICIFERAPKRFFNDLFRTTPKYIPTFIRISDPESAGNAPDGLSCLACESVDVDDDGSMEIRLKYMTCFADRISEMTAIIDQKGSQWKLISPDLSTIGEEAAKIANKDVYPNIDEFRFINPRNPNQENETLYGLSSGGYISTVSNPYTGGINWLYCVTITHFDDEYNPYWNYAFVMVQLTGNDMIREPDWNVGSVYFPEYEDRDVDTFVDELWGWSSAKEYNIPWKN